MMEAIEQVATRIAGDFLRYDVPCNRIYRLVKDALEAQREGYARLADEHRARVPNHDPEAQADDLVGQGYGNAAFNIAAAIRNGEAPVEPHTIPHHGTVKS